MLNVISTEKHPIKLWVSEPEEGALQQARNVANLPFVHKWVALMPDAHQGYSLPIGGVVALKDVISPMMVGVDIGCGMSAARLSISDVSTDILKTIMGEAREVIPVGFNHHKAAQDWDGFGQIPDIDILQKEAASASRQLGTLGGGNHFIEVQKGDDGNIWLMIHSGSRNLGKKVADLYNSKAQELCKLWHVTLPEKDLAFLPVQTTEGAEYLQAMNFCLRFARENRTLMMQRLSSIFKVHTGATLLDCIDVHHNYASLENHYGENVWVHRKGATLAREGVVGIIPGSMGSSSYIVMGKGNPESFNSCSHGAGRKMGRKEACRSLDLAAEQAKMAGIVHGLRNQDDLEEAPGAYKDIDQVMENQKDLVKILVKLTPLASIKG